MQLTTLEVLALAEQNLAANLGHVSSARVCYHDAQHLYAIGDDDAARTRALRSLSYSVGVFHSDYEKASK